MGVLWVKIRFLRIFLFFLRILFIYFFSKGVFLMVFLRVFKVFLRVSFKGFSLRFLRVKICFLSICLMFFFSKGFLKVVFLRILFSKVLKF